MTEEKINHWFKYHQPSDEVKEKLDEIREAARVFALSIHRLAPDSADKTVAIRKTREAMHAAISSLVLDGK